MIDLNTLPRPPAWTEQALCAQVSLDAWFPGDGERGTEAKRICGGCPVIEQCRQMCIDLGEMEGIWAGQAASTIQRNHGTGRKERPIEHGTERGYRTHRRRGEAPCARCTTASTVNSADQAARRAQKRVA